MKCKRSYDIEYRGIEAGYSEFADGSWMGTWTNPERDNREQNSQSVMFITAPDYASKEESVATIKAIIDGRIERGELKSED